jgi:hypothetical protein
MDLPQSTLCERLVDFANELFTFVWHPGAPSENKGGFVLRARDVAVAG